MSCKPIVRELAPGARRFPGLAADGVEGSRKDRQGRMPARKRIPLVSALSSLGAASFLEPAIAPICGSLRHAL